jgi:hypothetical protein
VTVKSGNQADQKYALESENKIKIKTVCIAG